MIGSTSKRFPNYGKGNNLFELTLCIGSIPGPGSYKCNIDAQKAKSGIGAPKIVTKNSSIHKQKNPIPTMDKFNN